MQEVAAAEPAVVDAYQAAEEVMTPQVEYSYLPYAQNYEYYGAASPAQQVVAVQTAQPAQPVVSSVPVAVQPAQPVVSSVPVAVQPAQPVVQAAVVQPVSVDGSQYHSQDDLGKGPNQKKLPVKRQYKYFKCTYLIILSDLTLCKRSIFLWIQQRKFYQTRSEDRRWRGERSLPVRRL